MLDQAGEQISFTAFVVGATARAAAAHPLVHAYRDWRGRLVVTDHVDVATLIEVEHDGHLFPLAHLVRDADIRTVPDLSAELRRVKADSAASRSGRLLRADAGALSRIPSAPRVFYWLLEHIPRMREMAGTVSVTSVGMFGSGGGFGIGQPTIMTLTVLVGGRTLRPRVVDGAVVPRQVLDLTITVDHAVVDGAPAARFASTLTGLIERPRWAAP